MISLTCGLLCAWRTAGLGGTLGSAPHALLVIFAYLGAVSIPTGAAGIQRGAGVPAAVTAGLVLFGYYGGTWVYEPAWHSLIGDAVFIVVVSIPIVVGTALGRLLVSRYRVGV